MVQNAREEGEKYFKSPACNEKTKEAVVITLESLQKTRNQSPSLEKNLETAICIAKTCLPPETKTQKP